MVPEHAPAFLLQSNLRIKKQLLFYDKLFDNVNSVIMVYDLNRFSMVWANDYFYKIVGIKKNQRLSAEKVIDRYHPDDREYILQLKKFLEVNKKGTFTGIYRFRNARGKYLWFHTSASIFRRVPDEDIFEVIAVSMVFSDQLNYHKNLKTFSQEQLQDINHKHISKITKREQQVVKYFAKGFKTREIAELLGLSFHTINNHRKNILNKLELKNLAALVNFAVENGLD